VHASQIFKVVVKGSYDRSVAFLSIFVQYNANRCLPRTSTENLSGGTNPPSALSYGEGDSVRPFRFTKAYQISAEPFYRYHTSSTGYGARRVCVYLDARNHAWEKSYKPLALASSRVFHDVP
jgi:hypothetical protein